MSDTTPAPTVEATPAPLVAPDLSAATVSTAVSELTTASAPFIPAKIPAKIRAVIYTVGGLVAVASGAVALVIGGVIGRDLDLIGSAAGVVVAVLGVSHVGTK
jgi:hypothetical protein